MTDVNAIEELEKLELPVVTPRVRRAYSDYVHISMMKNFGLPADIEQSAEDAAAAESIKDVAERLQELVEQAESMFENSTLPLDVRERAARAYFRGHAPHILLSNALCEHQKAWPIARLAKTAKGQADRIVAVWSGSEDPHAPLVAELQRRTKLGAKELAKVLEAVCNGWTLQTPDDEADYTPSPKVVRKKMSEAVAVPGVGAAVGAWLDKIDAADYERRVLQAGAMLAADGSKESAARLRGLLDTADTWKDELRFAETEPRAWATAVWSKLAPPGSAVAALLGGKATPVKAAKLATTKTQKPAKKPTKPTKPTKATKTKTVKNPKKEAKKRR